MPNVPVSDKAMEAAAPLVERIEACREPLTRAAAQAGECYETASIFGWAYAQIGHTSTRGGRRLTPSQTFSTPAAPPPESRSPSPQCGEL